MPLERQKQCPGCGPVLARKIDTLTPGESMGLALLTVCTCGLGLLGVIPYVVYRASKARGWHCPRCGSQILD